MLSSDELITAVTQNQTAVWQAWLAQLPPTGTPLPEDQRRAGRDALKEATRQRQEAPMLALAPRLDRGDVEPALSVAARDGWLEGVKHLLPWADPQRRRSHPMLTAAAQGHLAVMRYLWENDACNAVRDGSGWVAKAMEQDQAEAMVFLLERLPAPVNFALLLSDAFEQGRTGIVDAAQAHPGLDRTIQTLLNLGLSYAPLVDRLALPRDASVRSVCLETFGSIALPRLHERVRAEARRHSLAHRPPAAPRSRQRI